MNLFSLHTFLTCCFIGASSFAMGQSVHTQTNDETYSDNSKKTMRVIAFRSVESDDKLGAIYYDYMGKKVELAIHFGSLSASMDMPKGKAITLYQKIEVPAAGTTEKKTKFTQVGTVPLVEGSKVIVLFTVPEDMAKGKIHGHAFKDSKSIHPKQTARVFNVSNKAISMKAADEKLELPVGESGVIKWKAVAFNSIAYEISSKDKKTDVWEVFESAESAALPNARTFVFVSSTRAESK